MKVLENRNLQAGQSLIEALLALAFAVVIITAVVIAVITSLNNTTFTKNQNLASQYAQEGIDIARNMRDSSYAEFKALPNNKSYCAGADGKLSTDSFCTVDGFERRVFLDHTGLDEKGIPRCQAGSSFVASIVSWIDSKCTGSTACHSVQLDSCFADPNRAFGP